MKHILDKSLFREKMTDSGSLATLSSILHRIAVPGDYRGIVYRGTVKAGKFLVSVSNGMDTSTVDTVPRQVNIDLATLDNSTGAKDGGCTTVFPLRTAGYLVFSVSTGSGEYAVELFCIETKKEPVKVFDSRKLGSGDLFVTNVIRPGTYTVRNTLGKGHADLTVEYPEPGKIMRRMKPLLVDCKDDEMKPAVVKILPSQALMFSCPHEFRIVIDLKKADDRPRPLQRPAVIHTQMKAKEKTGQKTILRKIRFFG